MRFDALKHRLYCANQESITLNEGSARAASGKAYDEVSDARRRPWIIVAIHKKPLHLTTSDSDVATIK